ncbi:sensor histidine kinase [Paenibacillus donghaensis]|uniref:histidine kinase n=1 Tax=Paenibacillus donghaensis TaxID=414771 RepID=A0A2Z2KU24_9BACL|nr:HAMP domain-containing sensor histidine kinase [Paenibacillus donghaensis]ASA25512.1 two-component sensor histidine kinase [Paenibacillus donghaensis]
MSGRPPAWLRRLLAPRSLRKQLLAISLLILSALLLLIGVLQYVLMRDFTYTNRAESMETQIRSVPREFYYDLFNNHYGRSPMTPGDLPPGAERRPLLLDAHTTIAIYSSDGVFKDFQEDTFSEDTAPRLTDEEYSLLLQQNTERTDGDYRLITAADGSEHLAVFMNLGRPGNERLLLQMSVRTGPLTDVIMQQLLIFAGLSVVALLAGFFLYLPALRKTLVPLSNMGEAAQSIDSGNLNIRFPVEQGQSEIDQLAHSFNGMLERLEISFNNEREAKEQMRRFAADASHELRTPLTSIHGFLEVLLRGAAENKEQLYNSLRSMQGESKRINKLVEDLLLLARMDGAPVLQLSALHLGEVLSEMKPQLLVLAGERQVSFDISYGIRGRYDPNKLKQVVLNLFHNAVQHTDTLKGTIHVSLHARGGEAVLTVRDNGSGIAAGHLPYIFDRFYRSDSSRTRKYGGSGLGLSITQSIVEAHGGAISVSSKPGEGSSFRVTLPCLEGLAKPAP